MMRRNQDPRSILFVALRAVIIGAAVLAVAGATLFGVGASGHAPNDHGVFSVSEHGREVGLERFSVGRSGELTVARSELDYVVDNKRVHQQCELSLLGNGDLQSYQWEEGKARIVVGYHDGRVVSHYQPVTGAAQDFEFYMPASTAIVDSNVYIGWQLLADRYDEKRGGPQQFRVFVPHAGDPDQVTLTSLGDASAPGIDHPVLHMQAATNATTLDLYLEAGRLVRLEGPELLVQRAK
jgi:hypothetical protein